MQDMHLPQHDEHPRRPAGTHVSSVPPLRLRDRASAAGPLLGDDPAGAREQDARPVGGSPLTAAKRLARALILAGPTVGMGVA